VKSKKEIQLGMNPGTASYRLMKDILFSLLLEIGKNICFRCSLPLTRKDFSIEHKIPWLNSQNPVEKFFDITNISFSHLSCNCSAKTNKQKSKLTPKDYQKQWRDRNREKYRQIRKDKYKRLGT